MKQPLKASLDHLIFASYALEDGVNFIAEKLGVSPQKGGQHLTMGTHNAVLKLGDFAYLEVIAIDPELPDPKRPRWFGLDNLKPGDPPGLLTWVIRTNDIGETIKNSNLHLGNILDLHRGSYRWRIAIHEDGRMPLQGIAPTVIQWQNENHPSARLPFSGVTLTSLLAIHPAANELKTTLMAGGFRDESSRFQIEKGDTPKLRVTLNGLQGDVSFDASYLY